MASHIMFSSLLIALLQMVPLANGQESECSTGAGTQIGVSLVGEINSTMAATSSESCCYYSKKAGIKGWTFEVDGGDLCPNQSIFKGVAFAASSSGSHVVPSNSSDNCCALAVAYGRSMWTYDERAQTCTYFFDATGRHNDNASTSGIGSIPGLDKCSDQTVLEGVAFDTGSAATLVKTTSSDECCKLAGSQMRTMWSFNKRSKDCNVLYEMRGRHQDPDVMSAMGGTPGLGTCRLFSKVTGKSANPRATSANSEVVLKTDL